MSLHVNVNQMTITPLTHFPILLSPLHSHLPSGVLKGDKKEQGTDKSVTTSVRIEFTRYDTTVWNTYFVAPILTWFASGDLGSAWGDLLGRYLPVNLIYLIW